MGAGDKGEEVIEVADGLPTAEQDAAARNSIELVYGVGGENKADSSTRIQAELEA